MFSPQQSLEAELVTEVSHTHWHGGKDASNDDENGRGIAHDTMQESDD